MTHSLDFASDNWAGVSPPVLDAIIAANPGPAPAYGNDDVSKRMQQRFRDLFGCPLGVVAVPTGTAANGLALEVLAGRDGVVVGHEESHIFTKEAGARAFFNDRAGLVKLPGIDGRLSPEAVDRALTSVTRERGGGKIVVSLTQGTECGTVYSVAEVRALTAVARKHGATAHMDGARFANAVAALGCAPADVAWRAGVDVLSFGATKNGALGIDAIILFDPEERRADWIDHAHEACDWFGYVASKSRFAAAQLDAMLAEDHWLALAQRANEMADRLARGLTALPGVRLAFPRDINQVFAILPAAVDDAMRGAGARYHPWKSQAIASGVEPFGDERMARLVASFATTPQQVDALLAAASAASRAQAAE
jgi:threonine aldolase